MPDEDKQPYFDEYEAEKAVYTEQMKIYRNSPAFKRWIDAKQQCMFPDHAQSVLASSLFGDMVFELGYPSI